MMITSTYTNTRTFIDEYKDDIMLWLSANFSSFPLFTNKNLTKPNKNRPFVNEHRHRMRM